MHSSAIYDLKSARYKSNKQLCLTEYLLFDPEVGLENKYKARVCGTPASTFTCGRESMLELTWKELKTIVFNVIESPLIKVKAHAAL